MTRLSIAILILLANSNALTADLVSNGDFSSGSFAVEGDDNFESFGDGFSGTLILPGESILSDWEVSFSEFDADQTFSFDPPGLEWTDAEVANDRWIDFNRGGDLWRVTQTLDTVVGQQYRLVHDVLSGDFDGGATLQISLEGISTQTFTTVSSEIGSARFEEFSYVFIADSSSTVLSLSAVAIGLNEITGPQVSNGSWTAVPEPTCLPVLLIGLIGFAGRRSKSNH